MKNYLIVKHDNTAEGHAPSQILNISHTFLEKKKKLK